MFLNTPPDHSTIQRAVSDTLTGATHAGARGGGEGGKVDFGELLHHVYDSREIELPFVGHVHLPHLAPVHLGGLTLDLSPTKHVVFLWLGALLLILLAIGAARSILKNRVPHGFGNLVESFVLFVRDEICIPNMGPAGVRYMPYLLTTFFFILILNQIGRASCRERV